LVALTASYNSHQLLNKFHEILKQKNGNEILEFIVKLLFFVEDKVVFNISWWNRLSYKAQLLIKKTNSRKLPLGTIDTILNEKYNLFNNIKNVSIQEF
jgi:hypothetical protein